MIGFTDIEQKMNIELTVKGFGRTVKRGKGEGNRKLTKKERGKLEREKREDTEAGEKV